MIPFSHLQHLDTHTLVHIIVQLTDHPEAGSEDAELLRIAGVEIGTNCCGQNKTIEIIDAVEVRPNGDLVILSLIHI